MLIEHTWSRAELSLLGLLEEALELVVLEVIQQEVRGASSQEAVPVMEVLVVPVVVPVMEVPEVTVTEEVVVVDR